MILDSKSIKYEVVDIAEPNSEDAKEFMQNNATSLGATVGDMNPRSPLPPQIFNDTDYCGVNSTTPTFRPGAVQHLLFVGLRPV